uniref:SCO-spondin-like isoform X1 n=1 Tax=Styela clava TaxID=7725 RepID=UPI00193A3427|nr:SCO-spondin-like isoform X1 [Styela clava]
MLKIIVICFTFYVGIHGQDGGNLNSVLAGLFNNPQSDQQDTSTPQSGLQLGSVVGSTQQNEEPKLPEGEGTFEWSGWGQWSNCRVTCGEGERLRQRVCYFYPEKEKSGSSSSSGGLFGGLGNMFGGENGIGSVPSDILQLLGDSGGGGGLSNILLMSSLMGGGGAGGGLFGGGLFGGGNTENEEKEEKTSSKERGCPGPRIDSIKCFGNPCPAVVGKPIEIKPIDTSSCLGEWGSYGQCTSTCGRAIQIRARKCSCKDQSNNLSCNEPMTDSRPCLDNPSCVVVTTPPPTTETITKETTTSPAPAGKWSPWGDWTGCRDIACGIEISESRYRGCIGSCTGEFTESRPCPVTPCSVSVPKWSEWGPFSKCSETCGPGTKIRFRACDETDKCEGEPFEMQSCEETECPKKIEANWGEWGDFSVCTTACGTGQKYRYRSCNGPGECTGRTVDIAPCLDNPPCAAATPSTRWSDWGEYTLCTTTCGIGTKSRTRFCITGTCEGDTIETIDCEIEPCKVITEQPEPTGVFWGDYSSWGVCKRNYNGDGCTQERYRACIGGATCNGSFFDRRSCTSGECSLPNLQPTVITTTPPDQKVCDATSTQFRQDCGFPGITRDQCWAKGCCYSDQYQNLPWCFYDSVTGNQQNTGILLLGPSQEIGSPVLVMPKSEES